MEKLYLDILETAFFNLIITGTIIAMLYGFWLLIFPDSAIKLGDKINKNFSMRKHTKSLETQISIESWFYHHSKITGSLLMAGAAYLIYLLFWNLDFLQLAKVMPGLSVIVWEWLLQTFQIFFSIMSMLVLLAGFLVIVRPSILKPLEHKANKWISTRQKMQFMSDNVGQTDRVLSRFPRQFGAVILIFSAIVLLNINKFNF